jgi:DnaK suppressor protein
MADDPPLDAAAWRARLIALLAALEDDSARSRDSRAVVTLDQQSVGRLARMDAMERQAMAAATERRRQTEAVRLREALKRLDADDFGWCAECGERIADRRLDLDPATPFCADCAGGR